MKFELIPNSIVITRCKGIFTQRKAYQRNGYIYCSYGNSFIRLMKEGTSISNISVEDMALGFTPEFAPLGYMIMPVIHKPILHCKKLKKGE